jgi:predicted enzyme related to lactoylglutathione lyase/uncharacterized protein YjiS (DUF1127 family)
MMSTPLKVWWHELNTWEPEQARHFYNATLGWDFQPTALPDGARYWVAHKDGRAVGGIFQLTEPDFQGIPSHWMTYLAVETSGRPDARRKPRAATSCGRPSGFRACGQALRRHRSDGRHHRPDRAGRPDCDERHIRHDMVTVVFISTTTRPGRTAAMTILPLATRVASSFHKLFRPTRQRDVYARLTQYDDHLLRDIGLSRLDVEAMRRVW